MTVNTKILFRSHLTPDQVVEFVASALGVPSRGLNCQSTADDLVEWDSMGILCLLTALNREGISFPPGDVGTLQSMQGVLAAFRAVGRME